MLEIYQRVCGEFLDRSIFYPIVVQGSPEPTPARECYWRWLKKVGENGDQNGGWSVCLDLRDCYGRISNTLTEKVLREYLKIDTDRYLTLLCFLYRFGPKLVQGYLISDLLAAIVLTAIDRDAHRFGFVMARYSDDCVFSCSSKEEGEKIVEHYKRFLAPLGFELNGDKVSIEGPERLDWLRNGGHWGGFPVERFLKPPKLGRHMLYGAEASYQEGVDLSEHFKDAKEAFNSMYALYSKPPLVPRLESVHRQIVRAVANFDPERIVEDSTGLTGQRSSDTGLILKSKLPSIMKSKVAYRCRDVRGGAGKEDAAATLLENVPMEHRNEVVPRVRKSIARGTVLRRAMLDTASRDEESIDLAFRLICQRVPDLAEAACFQRLAIEVGGRSGKRLCQAVEAVNPNFGVVREILEQAVSDRVFL